MACHYSGHGCGSGYRRLRRGRGGTDYRTSHSSGHPASEPYGDFGSGGAYRDPTTRRYAGAGGHSHAVSHG